MSTIFQKIIEREIPGHFIYEDDTCAVILDRTPAVKGQSLVIPKEAVDYAFTLEEDTYLHLFSVAKKIASASDIAFDTHKTCLVVEGFDVPHVHIKLYPMQKKDAPLGERMHQGEEASDEELAVVATQIIAALDEG